MSFKTPIYVALIILVLLGAGAFRFARLDLRPMHGDEANQAVKAGRLLDQGEYAYDPVEHHGPTLYYAALPVFRFFGAKRFVDTTEVMYRVVPACFGMGLILLLLLLRGGLGPWTVFWAMTITALSNPMVYYSRYFIQETLLVFFALGIIVFGWWYGRTRRFSFALLTGICLGLTQATKETCIVIFAAMAGSLILTSRWGKWRDGTKENAETPWNKGYLVAGIAAALAVSVVLYSSLFTHWRGVVDSLSAYTAYFGRAQGAGGAAIHDKPWYYYLALLAYSHREAGPRWTEAVPMLLGIAGMTAALRRRKDDGGREGHAGLLRFLTFYTVLTTVFYALIPYKTPWNLLVFWQPWLIMSGVGVMAVIRRMRWMPAKTWFVCFLVFFLWQLSDQTWRSNFRYPADVRNPYVYAHTTTAIRRLTGRLEDLAAVSPKGKALRVNIISPTADYWPLPWYLRSFTAVGYYNQVPESPDADVIIASPALKDALPKALKDDYFREFHALRPNALLHVYIRRELWDAFIDTRR